MPPSTKSPLCPRRVSACLLAALLLLAFVVLSACGSDSEAEPDEASPPPNVLVNPPPAIPPEVTATPEPTEEPVPEEELEEVEAEPTPPGLTAADMPATTASGAIVFDPYSGTTLYEQGSDIPLAPASVTKIFTAIVALEQGNLDSVITASVDSRPMVEGQQTVMGLEPGDQFTLRDLLYGLLLPSGNDAAIEIAYHISGSEGAFVDEMNALASRLGLTGTSFTNVHGLDSPGHYTTARDLAIATQYAYGLPEFAQIVGTGRYNAVGSRTLELKNFSLFLYSYPDANGVKSGYTVTAGDTLVASANRGGQQLLVVLLNTPAYENEAALLMDWGFASLGY